MPNEQMPHSGEDRSGAERPSSRTYETPEVTRYGTLSELTSKIGSTPDPQFGGSFDDAD